MSPLSESPIKLDALVVGAGMGGIYATYQLSRAGLTVQCIDAAGEVGGTWYWNKYPGAMSDTETFMYRYTWDKEDLQTYPWDRHYVYQPEILKYLQHIVQKHGLRKHMRFNTEMRSASWEDGFWKIVCKGGQAFHARYLVTCLGLLSTPKYPDIPGLSSYKGQLMHTSNWDENATVEGKTVGIIGNGSTGIQVMTAIAPEVGQLISFQRSPQYSVPSGQGQIEPGYRERINANYDKIIEDACNSFGAFGFPESSRETMQATPEERREAFQKMWDRGNGLRFLLGAFGDLATNREANQEACNFIHGKIAEIVKDPRKAKALKPHELYARRPLCDAGYYEIFNRENVDIVDLRETSIERIEPEGIRMTDGKFYKLDVLILATGFDAIDGSYIRLNITGRDGQTLREHWNQGTTAYGSVACSGFPNMFLVAGPQGPFANFPFAMESEMDLVMGCIRHAESSKRIMEATPTAERQWSDICDKLVEGSLFKETPNWIFGENIKGKKPCTRFYFGGIKGYREWVRQEIDSGFPGFKAAVKSKL